MQIEDATDISARHYQISAYREKLLAFHVRTRAQPTLSSTIKRERIERVRVLGRRVIAVHRSAG